MEVAEKELIVRCQKGDEKAFEEMYFQHHHSLMQVCLRYGRDMDEAKDMFQTGFIRIVQNINKYDGSGSFAGWLKRIMVNESINYYHRVSRRGKLIFTDDDAAIEYRQDAVQPEGDSNMGHQELLKLVRSLPDSYRLVFTMYAIDGFSHKEVAEALNISVSTSKSNLSRARGILQKKVHELSRVDSNLQVKNG